MHDLRYPEMIQYFVLTKKVEDSGQHYITDSCKPYINPEPKPRAKEVYE